MFADRYNPRAGMPGMPGADFSVAAPINNMGGGNFGGGYSRGGGGITTPTPTQPQAPTGMLANLAAYYNAVGRPNNVAPFGGSQFGLPYNPSQPSPFMPHGFQPPIMPMTGGGLPPMQQGGGYDSSGINPHGMYNGTFGQAPPSVIAARNLGFGGR